MDSSSLRRFMISRKKGLALTRKEITDAITESVDACRLVIDAVDDFLKQGESVEGGGRGCWTIEMLLWALYDSEGRKGPHFSDKMKGRAAEVTDEWRKRYVGKGDGEGGGSKVQIFLQLVEAFGLSSRFDGEELMKLVLEHASREKMTKIAAGLGFGDKMAEIIDELVKNEMELEALSFACEAGLREKYATDILLKSYLHNARMKATEILKNGNHSATATDESMSVESNAIRSIIELVEYYRIEPKFSIDGLKKRLAYIERARAERQKKAAPDKSENRRAPSVFNSAPNPRPSKAIRVAPTAGASSYHSSLTHHTYHNSARATYGAAHAPPVVRPPYGGPSSADCSGYNNYAAPSPTVLSAPYGAAHAPTVVRTPYGGPSSANCSGYNNYAAPSPAVLSAPYGAAHAPTVVRAPYGGRSSANCGGYNNCADPSPTVLSAPYGAAHTPTVLSARYGAAHPPTELSGPYGGPSSSNYSGHNNYASHTPTVLNAPYGATHAPSTLGAPYGRPSSSVNYSGYNNYVLNAPYGATHAPTVLNAPYGGPSSTNYGGYNNYAAPCNPQTLKEEKI